MFCRKVGYVPNKCLDAGLGGLGAAKRMVIADGFGESLLLWCGRDTRTNQASMLSHVPDFVFVSPVHVPNCSAVAWYGQQTVAHLEIGQDTGTLLCSASPVR